MKHEISEELDSDGNNFLWVHIKKFSIDIGAVYRQPSSNMGVFLNTYETQLSKRNRALVFGDLNINILNKDKTTKNYKSILQQNGFKILNKIISTHCTRETENSKTLLDHVATNLKNNTFHMALIDSAMSDHKQIYFEAHKYQPDSIQKIRYEAVNYKQLYITIEESLLSIENVFDKYDKLEKLLIESIAKNRCQKYKYLNPPKADWINRNIITEVSKRNILWQTLKQIPEDDTVKDNYIKQRTLARNTVQLAKNQYYYKAFKSCTKNPLKMWQLINSLANNKPKSNQIPNKLSTSNSIISNPKDICETFNTFFSKIGAELANKIPKQHYNHLIQKIQTNNNPHFLKLSVITPATCNEISQIMDKLNTNSSTGIDKINTKAIKCVKNLILENLTKSINKCLITGQFPDTLKIAKVTPIHKSGDKMDPSNYRPISVLPVISKIFEKIMHNRLTEHLNSLNFLYIKQYGFRPKSNTLAATNDLVTSIRNNIDDKKITLGVFIDLQKAFDTVSHDMLLLKLQSIGMCDTALELFKSYLSNRYQIVKINEHQSEPRPVSYGVPQGSILGPLLFLIYINSIHEIGLKGDVTLYADDTSIFYSGQTITSIIKDAQDDLNLLDIWLQSNLLSINASKTNYIIFRAKNKHIDTYSDLTINGKVIHRIDKEKYLGLHLDSQLTWKPQIEKIRTKLISLTGALRCFARCLPRKIKYTIYNTMVKPHIDYLIEVWGSAAKTNINKLQISQNKLIKTLFNYDYLTSTQKIYKNTNIMTITQAYKYNTCILIKKIINKDIHSQILFTKKIHVVKRNTRQASNIYLRTPRTNYGKKNIMFEGAKLYNKLPKDLKEINSINLFKKVLKKHILKDFS